MPPEPSRSPANIADPRATSSGADPRARGYAYERFSESVGLDEEEEVEIVQRGGNHQVFPALGGKSAGSGRIRIGESTAVRPTITAIAIRRIAVRP